MAIKSVFDTDNKSRLLVFHAKYGDIYFRACNWDAVYAASLCILKGFNDAHYYDPGRFPEEPRQTRQQVDALPDNTMEKFEGLRDWRWYDKSVERYKEDADFKSRVDAVLSSGDKGEAWSIITMRNDLCYPHETFSVEHITSVECLDE